MDIKKIQIGHKAPWEVNVIIEIPFGGVPVKYEIDKESGAMFVDRFLHTAMYYPANYGFIPQTMAADGDPVDALVVGSVPVIPGAVIRSRPIGVLRMEDESGQDEKILMVPVNALNPYYINVKTYQDLPEILCKQIAHFFEHYKDLEHGKWVKILKWGTVEEAIQLIKAGIERAAS
jgi:inorganic pyrophosphatase